MKIIISILSILFCVNKINAQDFESNFLENEYLYYKGVHLKIDKTNEYGLTLRLFDNIEDCFNPNINFVAYPDTPNYTTTSSIKLLSDKEFIVEDILNKNGEPIKEIIYQTGEPIFQLKEINTNKLIYMRYDPGHMKDLNFPFLTSKINFPENEICSKITKKVDDFTNEIDYYSPSKSPKIIKNINGKTSTYYLYLSSLGQTYNPNIKGIIILFKDGTKMIKDVKISSEPTAYGHNYSCYVLLNQNDLNILSTKNIKKYRLYIYDSDVSSIESEKFRLQVKCIQKLNNL